MAGLLRRGKTYYACYYAGGEERRVSLRTTSLQIAKDKVRKIESALVRQEELPLSTRTPIADIVAEYVRHIQVHKTERAVRADVFYLREMFGPCCEALTPPRAGVKKNPNRLTANVLEDLATADVSRFLAAQVQQRGLAPKTANRYREVLHTLVNWAVRERGIRMPGTINPVSAVMKYREKAPKIRFLSLAQIDEQLEALADRPQLQVMVAVYIYAGLRREEALWLTTEDVVLPAEGGGQLRVRAKTVNGDSWQPKTGSNRMVPISKALRRYLENYAPRNSGGRWYFPSPKGARWDADNCSGALRTANQRQGLQWGCLDYRHTFGSHLASRGESLYKIATLMGNSPEICRRHYAALIPEALEGAVEFRL
jgi:integrase